MDVLEKIAVLRNELGDRVIIPAHHYQAEEITRFADIIGDSYRLAVDVSSSDAEFIVFCGVHFMAEGAAVTAKLHQKVLMPDPSAGCPMADMITLDQAGKVLDVLQKRASREIVPVVYMNARAELKALCGRRGGAVCTSSNARGILQYYFSQGKGVFFFPDQHLGRNTVLGMGIAPEQILLIDDTFDGSASPDIFVYLWDGCCPVHQEFSLAQIEAARKAYPGITVIVHPEVNEQTAAAADMTGSTEYIYKTIHASPPGSLWAVGTEQSFVSRLAHECAKDNKMVIPLYASPCADMGKTTPQLLLETLEAVRDGAYHDREVRVSEKTAADARIALSRMIAVAEGGTPDE